MNATATAAPATAADTLADRIAKIRFYDIVALCKKVKGETLGFDVNRRFSGEGSKARFAQWAVENLDNAALALALPEYEAIAKAYYAANKPKAYKPKPAAAPAAKPEPIKVEPAPPMPVEPKPAEPQVIASPDLSAHIADILRQAEQRAADMDAVNVRDIRAYIDHELNKARPIVISGPGIQTKVMGRQHKDFEKLLRLCAARDRKGNRFNIWLTGPAGSGKTTAAEKVAEALGLEFHFTGAINNEYKLTGFIDAQGRVVCPAFRKAYENGGVFLFDEVDGSAPGALLALNAALANGTCDFPDACIKRHPDCVIIAAANTWGSGATHDYIGRNKLDDASRDRFKPMAWDYDEEMERDLSGNIEWAQIVQAIRARLRSRDIKHIVSPRATYDGADMLAQGFDMATVLDVCVRKGLSETHWNAIR